MNEKVNLIKHDHFPWSVYLLCSNQKQRDSWEHYMPKKERLLHDLYIKLKRKL